jgi:hypothetical protein
MAKTGRFTHGSTISTNVAAVGNTFDVAKYHYHPLLQQGLFTNTVEGLYIRVTNIAGGATKITARLCCDIDGDFTFLPDTEAPIATGLTTATTGTVAFKFGVPLKQFFGNSDVYLFIKTDAGTVTLANSCVVWTE